MNIKVGSADPLGKLQTRSSLLGAMLKLLIAILSSPKGDQGGWEGGARGL